MNARVFFFPNVVRIREFSRPPRAENNDLRNRAGRRDRARPGLYLGGDLSDPSIDVDRAVRQQVEHREQTARLNLEKLRGDLKAKGFFEGGEGSHG